MTAPILTSLSIPNSVDLSSADKAILNISAAAYDDDSGIKNVVVWFDKGLAYSFSSSSTSYSSYSLIGLYGFSDSWSDGQSELSYGISPANSNGNYNVTRVTVEDNIGNIKTYSPTELNSMGINTVLRLTGGSEDAIGRNVEFAQSTDEAGGLFKIELSSNGMIGISTQIQFKFNYASPGLSFDRIEFAGSSSISTSSTSVNGVGSVVVAGSITPQSDKFATLYFKGLGSGDLNLTIDKLNLNGEQGNYELPTQFKYDIPNFGEAGDDFILSSFGDDRIDGREGIDTVVYFGASTQYSISPGSTAFQVIDSFIDRDGTDSLTNIERLQFSDTNVALDIAGTAGQAYRIYEAVLGRAPDLEGLGYWINDMDNGVSLTTIAQGFIASPEFQNKYGANPSYETYINLLYNNILDRDPDPDGLNYWVSNMNNGVDTPAAVLASFSEGFENTANVASDVAYGIYYAPWIT